MNAEQRFLLEGFRDFLSLEAGHSPLTVESYLRDLTRMVWFAELKNVRTPSQVTRGFLRDFIYALKDLGLESSTIRRRRECPACAARFTTYERVEAARLVVVKRDGTRQEFDRDKLAAGLAKALPRRPVADDAAEVQAGFARTLDRRQHEA